MTYTVNSFDICTAGFERLRSNSEFILVTPVYKGVLGEEIRASMHDEIQSYSQPDEFDYEACRAAINTFIDENIAGNCVRLFGDIEPAGEDGEGCNLYVYMTGPGYAESE